MSDTHADSAPRFRADLRPEFVPLGFLVQEPLHGYELYRRFSESLSGLWRISESQMYATLKRMEDRGLLEGSLPVKGETAPRRILSPTSAGRALFESWLLEPTNSSPRALRLEFLTRLYFARRLAPDTLGDLFAAQRAAVAGALRRLRKMCPPSKGGFDTVSLALAFSEAQLRSVLGWLDRSVRPALEAAGE